MIVKGLATKSHFRCANLDAADLLIGKPSIRAMIRGTTIRAFALMIKGMEGVRTSQSRTSLAATGPEQYILRMLYGMS